MTRIEKFREIGLDNEARIRLEKIAKTPTEQLRKVQRSKILLLLDYGKTIGSIADKLDLNRSSVELCIDKFIEAGVDAALNDLQRSGRPAVITDEEKTWIVNLACQKPKELGYAQELWTIRKLQNHIKQHAEEAGFPNLKGIAFSTVNTILNNSNIKPHKIRYYLEKRDPDFDKKMNEVLVVYKQLELNFELNETPEDIFISYDEKPGIQAKGNVADDLSPTRKHGFIGRDSEYKRHGTVSLLAGMDLYTGEIIPLVSETHKSSDFIDFLKLLDEKYDDDVKIKVILDNHSVHTSKETRRYLETCAGRFEFIFTPKHGSWLNMIESFFGKFTKAFLRGIRVDSKEEMAQRIYQYFDEINQEPVVYRWTYKMDEMQVQ